MPHIDARDVVIGWLGAFILGAGVASILWSSLGPRKQPRDSRGQFVKAK